MEENKVHVRRKRYRGTHPVSYDEKYKEHDPEKYSDTVKHVIEKGMTPAGMHIPIMVDEIMNFLKIRPGQQGLDATLGYGGHTREMLRWLDGKGHLYATDVDPDESAKTEKRLRKEGFGEDIFTVRLMNFADADKLAAEVGQFDFVLADLGVSSMQIDDPKRGFSYKHDGPLDLRMNQQSGITAADRLVTATEDELAGMFTENADEEYADEIAAKIKQHIRKGQKIETTLELKSVIEEALSFIPAKDRQDVVRKSCARVFQALRIDINNEYEVLYRFLDNLPGILKPGGRVAVLTFHSGEDRLVKKSFRQMKKDGLYSEIADDVVRPQASECAKTAELIPPR